MWLFMTRKEKLTLPQVACTQITPNWTHVAPSKTMSPRTRLQKEIHTLIISTLNFVRCPQESRSLSPIPESCLSQRLAKGEDGSRKQPGDLVLVLVHSQLLSRKHCCVQSAGEITTTRHHNFTFGFYPISNWGPR